MQAIIGADYPNAVRKLVEGAKKNIDIVSYDWRWYANQPAHAVQRLNVALVNAAKRGVRVRAVLNKADLVPTLNAAGIQARTLRDKRTLHAKMLIVDGRTLVIGSHNLTRNAFSHNVEASLAVEIPDSEGRFSQFFENLWAI